MKNILIDKNDIDIECEIMTFICEFEISILNND